MKKRPHLLLAVLAMAGAVATSGAAVRDEPLVSASHRYLLYTDGTPFFYLGDTARELFHRLNREQADPPSGGRGQDWIPVIEDALQTAGPKTSVGN